jgi:ATP-dependent Lon protease
MFNQDHDMTALEDLENSLLSSLDEAANSLKKHGQPPSELFLFPLLRRPFFPGMAAPLVIEAGPYYELLKKIARGPSKWIGLFLTKKEDQNLFKLDAKDLCDVGVAARVLKIIPTEQGGAQVILNIEKRITIESSKTESKRLKAVVKYHSDNQILSKEMKAYSVAIISTIKELLKLNPLFKEELQLFLSHSDFSDPGRLADFAVALTTGTREELQDVLETFDVGLRVDKSLALLRKELDLSQIQNSINKKIDATISKSQKEFFLREQLKTIKKELGIEKDDKSLDREKFEERLKQRTVPEDVQKLIKDELDKLSALEPQSSEYGVTRNYLDWLTVIPWGLKSQDRHDLDEAEKILKEDHYGLEDIKERILEFISVGKLTGGVKGSIICLVGPPGVGKTSIGKSIARALNRKFFRFSVGGMRDEAEIKGHRRTYVGAQPGKIVQALKLCQTMNPVIMLDEIDKMGASFHGDPGSALLEVLDKEQNGSFLDHYLDIPIDLSGVLFVTTSNVLDSIPEPLLDRMEILRLSGYIQEEKLEIAKKYLIPVNRKQMGIKPSQISFTNDSLKTIINGYAREAGVRSLENNIKKILRKVATKLVREDGPPKHAINEKNIQGFLGKPHFTTDRYYEKTPVGVSTGLAWTSMGGATLYIETMRTHHEKTDMMLTGRAGEVMKESARIAWTYLNGSLEKYAKGHTFFEKSMVHIHIPEGATPKDGPSAGITMATSLLSLLLDEPILENLGMTGEITLTGRVLAIGGVKEKLVAARRSGLKSLIFPKENARDWAELPAHIKNGIDVHFVTHYDEVFKIAFPRKKLKR